jgi:hypothetical protein
MLRLSVAGAGLALAWATVPTASAAIVGPDKDLFTAHADLRFTSDSTDPLGTTQMRVEGPGEPPLIVPGGREGGAATVLLKTRCPSDSGSTCAGGRVAPNGLYTVVEDVPTGGGERREIRLSIGGLPVEPTAQVEGHTVTVRWQPGPELDVRSWSVEDDLGGWQQVAAARDVGTAAQMCPGGVCSAAFAYPPTVGGQRTFSVRAFRPCGVKDCREDVAGAPAVASAALPPAVAAEQAAGAPAPGTEGPTPGGPATGGTGTASRPGSLSGFGPSLAEPERPPLPGSAPPLVATPVPDGPFDPTLGQLPERAGSVQRERSPQAAGREGTPLTSTGGMLGDEQVARAIAASLVLALSGAHLRAWLSKPRDELA